MGKILKLLQIIYGPTQGKQTFNTLLPLIEDFQARHPELLTGQTKGLWSERDAILITYADQFQSSKQAPLQTLQEFLATHLSGLVNWVHILPFYPYSSDDGFAVIDYYQVNPQAGTWKDIKELGNKFKIIFDFVVNHVSSKNKWFQNFLNEQRPYTEYFIQEDPQTDLSQVVRPRTLPLLTKFETRSGPKWLWTTFSTDQIDLNFKNPDVLIEMTKVLLFYLEQGAKGFRLDAIAYLWKEVGTTCLHLKQTHAVVKLWRAILELVAPGTLILTETNVPHKDNISYFGNGQDEAHLVYQFSLPPLVLNAMQSAQVKTLCSWLKTITVPSPQTTFFNFLASHDGIGVMPAQGILKTEEIQALIQQTLNHGGQVSWRTLPDGSKQVYELNTTWFDFLTPPKGDLEEMKRRFLASQIIMLSLAGLPGIYVHNLFGSRNCHTLYEKTGQPRSLNREKFQWKDLLTELKDPQTLKSQIFASYKKLLHIRCQEPAFHPQSRQEVLEDQQNQSVLILLRIPDNGRPVLVLVNVSPNPVQLLLPKARLDLFSKDGTWLDLLTGQEFNLPAGNYHVPVNGYGYFWLCPKENQQA